MGETPFLLTYGTKVVIPIETYESTIQTEEPLDEEMNDKSISEELDLVEEVPRVQPSLKRHSSRK